jgi:hypothetical protein
MEHPVGRGRLRPVPVTVDLIKGSEPVEDSVCRARQTDSTAVHQLIRIGYFPCRTIGYVGTHLAIENAVVAPGLLALPRLMSGHGVFLGGAWGGLRGDAKINARGAVKCGI